MSDEPDFVPDAHEGARLLVAEPSDLRTASVADWLRDDPKWRQYAAWAERHIIFDMDPLMRPDARRALILGYEAAAVQPMVAAARAWIEGRSRSADLDALIAEARTWQHGRFGAAEPVAAELIGKLADALAVSAVPGDGTAPNGPESIEQRDVVAAVRRLGIEPAGTVRVVLDGEDRTVAVTAKVPGAVARTRLVTTYPWADRRQGDGESTIDTEPMHGEGA